MNGKIETQIIETLKQYNQPLTMNMLTSIIKQSKELKHYQTVNRACKNLKNKCIVDIWQLYSPTDNRELYYVGIVPDKMQVVYNGNKYTYTGKESIDGFILPENVKPSARNDNEIIELKRIIAEKDAEIKRLQTDKRREQYISKLVKESGKGTPELIELISGLDNIKSAMEESLKIDVVMKSPSTYNNLRTARIEIMNAISSLCKANKEFIPKE